VGYGLGKLASAESWTRFTAAAIAEAKVQEGFEYSGLRGNVSLKSTTTYLDAVAAASTSQSYSWHALGAIHELGYPTDISGDEPARVISHAYANGYLTAIPGYATSLTYHDNFALASVAHSNGVTDWIGQDPNRLGRPSALWTSGVANNEDWNSGAYLYDGSGNLRAIGGQRYRYDGVSRLMEAELRIPETSETLFGVESFTYDAYGNLTSRETTEGGSATTVNTPVDPATNRLTGATSYDSEGNLTSWNGAQYGFDALGRMTRMQNGAEDWLFAYSAGGERVLQVDQGGAGDKRWTVRDVAGRVLREWIEPQGGSPTWERDWIYRGQNLLATVDATTTRHLTLDHLGTPRLVTDPSGAKLAFKAYWPYGREATDPNQDALSKKFTGHERDGYDPSSTADDLDYMHARFANPETGRFLSMDPLSGAIGRPQSLNRYSYVTGNPIGAIDPTGRSCISVAYDVPGEYGTMFGTTDVFCMTPVQYGRGGGGGGGGGGYVDSDPLCIHGLGVVCDGLNKDDFDRPAEQEEEPPADDEKKPCPGVKDTPATTDILQQVNDLSAGFGDALLLGFGDELRSILGIGGVDMSSGAYAAGGVAGTVAMAATGVAGGVRAAGARGAGREFSHWIPARHGGSRSILNGNYVSAETHALSDPFRYRFMSRAWKAQNPMPSVAVQQVVRVPNTLKGAAAGGAAAALGANGGCD